MVRWLKLAENDLISIEDYIAVDNPLAAIEIAESILTSTEKLDIHPEIGRKGRIRGTREMVVVNTSYIVIYRLNGGDIEILRVLHGAQRRIYD
jgi:toxin ParE1/3/4